MNNWDQLFREPEPVAIIVLLLLFGSLVQGMRRGASGSARRLFFFIWEGVVIIVCLLLAGQLANRLSPMIAEWLIRNVNQPKLELASFDQPSYTQLTSISDYPLLRNGVI